MEMKKRNILKIYSFWRNYSEPALRKDEIRMT